MTAWTTPKTWTATTLSVSDMNTHVRDNLNHLYERAPVYVVYKSADESRNTTTTVANDSTLLWAVAANEVWQFTCTIIATDASNGAADIKINWGYPTGTTAFWTTLNNTGAYGGALISGLTTAPSPVVLTEATADTGWGLTNGTHMFQFHGFVFVSSTAGTVYFKWAQAASNGSNVTVKKGSNLHLWKLA